MSQAPRPLGDLRRQVWAVPRSLAATDGIEVSFCSSRYLDVSVPRLAACGYVFTAG